METHDKQSLLTKIRAERHAFDALVGRLTDEAISAPMFPGGWAVKDMLLEIAGWERGLVDRTTHGRHAAGAPAGAAAASSQVPAPAAAGLSPAEARAESRAAHAALLARVEEMSEADLQDPYRWEWADGRPLIHVLAAGSRERYHAHTEEIARHLGSEEDR
jgi:hypothetical protein